MQCKICNLNETDSTSGICWECTNNMNIEQTNKRIRKKLMQLVDYHHVGHEVDFKTGFQCAFIKGQECNCGWREYEDDVMKLIESTLKEERTRIITIIENLDQRITSDGQEANTAYQQAFKDILKEI